MNFTESFEKVEELITTSISNLNIVNDNLIEIQKQIIELLRTIQEILTNNHDELKKLLNNFSLSILQHLSKQDQIGRAHV